MRLLLFITMASRIFYFYLFYIVLFWVSLLAFCEDTDYDSDATVEDRPDPDQVEQALLRAIALNRQQNTPPISRQTRPKSSPFDDEAIRILDRLRPSTSSLQPATNIEQVTSESDDSDPEYSPEEFEIGNRKVSLETIRTIVRLNAEGRTEKQLQRLYPWYYRKYLPKFKQVATQGYKQKDRFRVLNENVYARFQQAREKSYPVRGHNLRIWAMTEAKKLNITSFIASGSWLDRFKRNHRIRSRKVTKTVSAANIAHRLEDADKIKIFRENYFNWSKFFYSSAIVNIDQTGFNQEASTDRTLSHQGERDTFLHAESANKQTHSHTAQPVISRKGRLVGKLALVLQEDKARFGPLIKKKWSKWKETMATSSFTQANLGK